jgi:hypothetical protein
MTDNTEERARRTYLYAEWERALARGDRYAAALARRELRRAGVLVRVVGRPLRGEGGGR